MGKKPIKRNENIAKLSRDHHASLMFCWKLRQGIKFGISTERMVRYVQYFLNQHFLPHFTEEEEILFAPLKDETVQKAIDEHVVILRNTNEIIFSGKENQQKELEDLADLVDGHVRYEERILFPHLEQKLSEAQLEEIGKKIAEEAIKDNYEDAFWVKEK
jgi:hemerythrin-like domain-containing protein